MNTRINGGDVDGAAGFDQNGEAEIAKLAHESKRIALEERFSAGEFDQWELARTIRQVSRRYALDFRYDFGNSAWFSFRERVGSVAVGAPKITSRQSNKHARKSRKGAFTLQAEINFVDDERVGHVRGIYKAAAESKRAAAGVENHFGELKQCST